MPQPSKQQLKKLKRQYQIGLWVIFILPSVVVLALARFQEKPLSFYFYYWLAAEAFVLLRALPEYIRSCRLIMVGIHPTYANRRGAFSSYTYLMISRWGLVLLFLIVGLIFSQMTLAITLAIVLTLFYWIYDGYFMLTRPLIDYSHGDDGIDDYEEKSVEQALRWYGGF
ncbi:MAG: hypothetical protein H7A33_00495 [Deltaproteobacteria bacterium]|nr:hypothetical protein [Deltaproteobacteria bacterium]